MVEEQRPQKDDDEVHPIQTFAGSMAILFLERHLKNGGTINIPSLGITIEGNKTDLKQKDDQ